MSEPRPTGAMNSSSREWDAETYDQVSDPQFSWGMEVLERLALRGDETVVDAGCGSGRVAQQLLARLPEGHLIAVDGSEAMIAKARERLGEGATYLVSDLSELALPKPVDLVFSTATFHWIVDHERLFNRLAENLVAGGSLVAQCGGEGNVAEHARAIVAAAARPEFAPHFEGMEAMWNFAAPEPTEARLKAAGFSAVRCWLEPKPYAPTDPLRFTMTVTLGPHLARLPERLRQPFAEAVLDLCDQPITLDYVRLNIEAVAA